MQDISMPTTLERRGFAGACAEEEPFRNVERAVEVLPLPQHGYI